MKRLEFHDDQEWAKRYEAAAKAEGLTVAAWLRRLARMAASLPAGHTSEKCTHMSEKTAA